MMKSFPPQGAEFDGASVHYRIWAPNTSALYLEILPLGQACPKELRMLQGRAGYFHGLDEGGRPGDLYRYRTEHGPALPDPASRWQPGGVHGPSMVIDPHAFEWHDQQWQRSRLRDLVIYEIHLGTFTREGTFAAAVERLPHIKALGASAMELMPIGEFPGGRNWGYDGTFLYAPSRAYGHPDELRGFVDAAHSLGIAVILDVVYNHFGPDGNYLGRYVGEYLDEKLKTPWGGAIRYGDPAFHGLRELVVQNPPYWMREFHIDGFRLDATHAIADPTEPHLLTELTQEIHQLGGFAIAEDSRNESQLLMPAGAGGHGFDGVWADDFHHVVRVAQTHEDEAYLADFEGTLSELVDTLRHGWRYRGQFSLAQGRARGTTCQHLQPHQFVHCLSNHDQTGNHALGTRLGEMISPDAYRALSAVLCLTPYTPMLFMGQEWSARTPFGFFCEHQPELGKLITAGRREEFSGFKAFKDPASRDKIPDPQSSSTFEASKLRWEELNTEGHAQMLELYREFLAVRRSDEAFRPESRETWQVSELSLGAGALRLDSDAGSWLVLFDLVGGHAGSLSREAICQLPQDCHWMLVLSSNEARFGGDGSCPFDCSSLSVKFRGPTTILLRSQIVSP